MSVCLGKRQSILTKNVSHASFLGFERVSLSSCRMTTSLRQRPRPGIREQGLKTPEPLPSFQCSAAMFPTLRSIGSCPSGACLMVALPGSATSRCPMAAICAQLVFLLFVRELLAVTC